MASSPVDQISTTFQCGRSTLFRPPAVWPQLTPNTCRRFSARLGLCSQDIHLKYPQCKSPPLGITSSNSWWGHSTATNLTTAGINSMKAALLTSSTGIRSMKAVLSGALLSDLCVAYRASLVTAILQQYVRNIVFHSSLFNVGNTLLAPLWLPAMFLGVDPNVFNMNTSKEGIPKVNHLPTSEPCRDFTGHNNQKLDDSIKFPEVPESTQQQETPSNHIHQDDECKQYVCDSESDIIETESDCYSSDEECEDYETDSCVSDDCVEFSDDSTDLTQQTTTFPQTPKPDCAKIRYTTLFSEESGYCELQDDSSRDSDNEMCEDDQEVASILWRTFEEQALSPCPSRARGTSKSPSKHTFDKESASRVSPQADKAVYNNMCQQCDRDCTGCSCSVQGRSRTSKDCVKRVTFKSDSELVVIHHIVAWSFAYRQARKGPWEEYARDRDRFSRRIECCASILEPCLSRKFSQYSNSCTMSCNSVVATEC